MALPLEAVISRSFLTVNSWSTQLRYESQTLKAIDAASFLKSAKEILDWADGRL